MGATNKDVVQEACKELGQLHLNHHQGTADDGVDMQDSNNTEDRIKGELSNAEARATKPPDGNGKAISLSPLQDDEEEGNLDGPVSEGLPETTKKKKKKSKSKKKKEPLEQTNPPSIPVTELFPSGEFPEGEIQQYKDDMAF